MDILKNWRWWVGVGFLIAFFVFAWFLRALVFYVIISGVLSILFEPLVNKLRGLKLIGKGIPAGVVAFLVLLLIWGILALIISITIPIAAQEIRVLSSLDYDGITSKIQEMLSVFDGFLRDYGVLSGEGSSVMLQERIRSFFDLNNLTSIFGGFLSGIGNVFVAFFSISFITFFFLKETDLFKRILLTFIPDAYESRVMGVFSKSKKVLSRYLIGVFIEVLLITTLVSLGLWLAGVNNAFIIGVFAGLINVIPYVGPMIGASVGLLIAFTTGLDPGFTGNLVLMMSKAVGVFAVVQLMDNIIFQPVIFSNSVSAHPLEIFLVISMAGMLGGIGAMIIAVPTYSFIRIIAQEFLSEFKVVKQLTKHL